MQFDIITIFPLMFDSFLESSLIKKAIQKKLIKVKVHDLRKFANGNFKQVDDKPFGGGRGMVMRADVLLRAVNKIKKKNGKVVLFSPRGKQLNQKKITKFSKIDQIIMIAGRYEGIDERVQKYIADEVISIGNFVLMGGEIPCFVMMESVARLIPRVIGKPEEVKKRIEKGGFIEYPQYTRPDVLEIKDKKRRVPKVLLSGHHQEIEKWREKNSVIIE